MEDLGTIGFSEEQAELLDSAARFCLEKSPMDKVRKLMETEIGFDEAVWREVAALGWLGVAIPEEHGGVGLSLAEVAPIAEQMGRSMLASPFTDTILAAEALAKGGTPEQQARLLPRLAEGAIATLALSEPGGEWDLGAIEAGLSRDGDELVLSGVKTFVAYAPQTAFMIVSVLYEGAPALVIVDADALGPARMERETIIDVTKRSYRVNLDGVRIGADQLMEPGSARACLAHIDLAANLLASAEMAGATAACIDMTIDYLQTRKQFGRTIGSYQALKHPTVDAYTAYEQARSHVYAAAYCFSDQGAGEIAVRMAKAQTLGALAFAADRSIQFHGGFGFTWDCDAQLYRRRAAFHASQFGDELWQRQKLAKLLF